MADAVEQRSVTRWSAALTEVLRFGRVDDLAVSVVVDDATIVPRRVANLVLAAQGTARTRGENIALALACAGGALTQAQAGQLVRALEARGLLLSERAIRARLVDSARACAPADALDTLVISTCDRPGAMARCLRSHLDGARERGRSIRVIVCDDSRSDRNQAANRGVVAQARHAGVAIDCVGPVEKRRMMREISREAGVPPAILRFLLGDPLGSGYTPGANRNAALLALAGQRFVIVDDDTQAGGLRAPDASDAPVFAATSPWPPFRLAGRRGRPGPVRLPLLVEAERFLGRRVDQLVSAAAASAAVAVDNLGDLLATCRWTGPVADAGVAVVVFGLLGDHGMAGPWSILWQDGPEREQLLGRVAAYRAITERAATLWALSRPTIARRLSLCAGTALGLDNRRSLPPFLPIGRSEDQLFATMVGLCDQTALFAASPWAVGHRVDSVRTFPPEARWRGVGAMNFNTTLELMLRTRAASLFEGPGTTRLPGHNQQLLGEHLVAVAQLAFADAHAYWHELAVTRNLALQQSLHQLRERHGARPLHWAADIDRQLRELEVNAAAGSGGWPHDVALPMTAESYRRCVVPRLRLIGAAVKAWPQIREAAAQLDRNGRLLERARCA